MIQISALTDHSIACGERIVNLHESVLEDIEKESVENGKLMLTLMIIWS